MKNTSPSPKRRQILLWGGISLFAATVATFFSRGGKTTALLAIPELPPAPTAKEKPVTFEPSTPVEITHEGIQALLNSEFTLDRPDETPITGTLIEITPTRHLHGPKAEYKAFSLFFAAKGTFPKDGAICRISHPQLVSSEVFLTPVGRPAEGKVLLEAAFSFRV